MFRAEISAFDDFTLTKNRRLDITARENQLLCFEWVCDTELDSITVGDFTAFIAQYGV
jgi:hypothetical protein